MQQQAARVLESNILYDLPGKFGGWPSVVRTPENELLVVFSGDRKHHIDPYGKTLLVRSKDQGRSWSEPQIINDSPLDDRDPGILVCPDGSWLVSLFTSELFATWKDSVEYYGQQEVNDWQPYINCLTAELREEFLGYFTLCSTDQGDSWSALRRAPVMAPHGPIVEPATGELLFLGTLVAAGQVYIACHASRDQGESWYERGVLSNAHALDDIYLCEPHLVQLPDGRLLGQMRANSADIEKRQLMQSISADGGRSWSPVAATGLWGLPPHLLQHSSGVLLSSYGHRREPFGQRVALSYDAGKTWPQILTLGSICYQERTAAEDVGEIYYQIPDLGYPATVELADGTLYSVWYQSRPDARDALIFGCRWQLPTRAVSV